MRENKKISETAKGRADGLIGLGAKLA